MLLRTLPLAGAAALLATVAFAQASADITYCNSLSSTYRDYARSGQVDSGAAAAMDQCNSSPGSSIPVLEKILTDNRVPLPKRS